MVRILPQLKNLRGDVDQARAQHIEKLARARMSGTASAAQGTAAAWRKRRPTWLDSLTACHAMSPPTAADVQDRRRPYPGHFRDTICRLFIQLLDIIGVPKGIRTPVTAVKGRCPRPLDDGDKGRKMPPINDIWWSQAGSNRRPLACHASALPAELWPHSKPADATH